MKAIVVKYFGPTNTRGSRFRATAEGVKPFTVSYDHALSADQNAEAAARGLALRMDWLKLRARDTHTAFAEDYCEGCLPDGVTRVWVDVTWHHADSMRQGALAAGTATADESPADIRASQSELCRAEHARLSAMVVHYGRESRIACGLPRCTPTDSVTYVAGNVTCAACRVASKKTPLQVLRETVAESIANGGIVKATAADAPREWHEITYRDENGSECSVSGDSLEALAGELAAEGYAGPHITVYDDRGFTLGFVAADYWRAV
jgi:hypothetical protein